MLSGQQVFMLVLGIIACFTGYSMFRSMLPLWGFLLGGWFAYTFLPTVMPERSGELLAQIIAFAAGGLVGAAISIPLYFVVIFLSGAALGMILGVVAGAMLETGGIGSVAQLTTFTAMSFPPIPQTGLQYVLMAIFGLIMGGLALGFQKFMICAASAFLGSAAIVTGLSGFIARNTTGSSGYSAVMLVAWMVLAFVGLFLQFRMSGDV